MQAILLKDQFIFGITMHEIQEHLLNEISDDHDLNQCLAEAGKIESCIAQRKLLGLKSQGLSMMLLFSHQEVDLRKCLKLRIILGQNQDHSQALETVSIVVTITNVDSAQLTARNARVVARKIILPRSVNLEARTKDKARDHSNIGKLM